MADETKRVVVVTGVGAGMVVGLVAAFADARYTVVGCDIDLDRGAATMGGLGPGASFVPADVADLAEGRGLIERVVADHGRLDVPVDNVGVTRSLGFFVVTEENWDRINAVNARGLFVMQAAATARRDAGTGGRIVNIASIAGKGYRGTSNVAHAGTGGSVIAMTRIAASQLARYDVNVNAICPGVTRTALFDQVIDELVERAGSSR